MPPGLGTKKYCTKENKRMVKLKCIFLPLIFQPDRPLCQLRESRSKVGSPVI